MDSPRDEPKRSILDRYKTFVTDLGDQVVQETAEKQRAQEDLAVANERLRKQVELFRRFVPGTLTRAMAREDFDVRQGISQEETYSVLSCDIRNFTSFSESVSCTECFRFLNSYFAVMERGIRNFGGFIYQYVGDGIMALFEPNEEGNADNAVHSAVSLQHEIIAGYNEGRERAGYPPIRIGIGINTGLVATGIAGTPERMDASAFGNTVNISARCESLTKDFNTKIIITEHTYRLLSKPDLFRINSLGQQSIRGLESKIELYEVLPDNPA